MGFKEKLLKIARSLGIKSDDLDSVGIYEWPDIMKKIESKFVMKENSNTKFNWWWEDFKRPSFSRRFLNDDAMNFLVELVPNNEKIWFIGCNSEVNATKFWLFEGRIKAIQHVLSEMHFFDYYLVSKKYEWLLCENDHSVLIALGTMIEKLKSLEAAETIPSLTE